MEMKKKFSMFLMGILVILLFAGCSGQTESEKFDAFIQQVFVDTMESDYTTAHVFMEEPKTFGVDESKITVNLGERIDETAMESSRKSTKESLDGLKAFDRAKLTEEQQDTYDILMYMLTVSDGLNDEKFDYYQQLLESMTGIHYQLPALLADWELRDEQDVKDLITLVNDVQPYMSSLLEYTKEQEKRGLLMIDIDEVISYCEKVCEKGEESSILTALNEGIDALSLGDEPSSTYKTQLREAFTTSFLPAYEDIISTLNTFKSGTNNEEGYAKFPNGKDYYELLLQRSIGSTKSVEEIRQMMSEAFTSHIMNLQEIMASNPEILETLQNELPTSGYDSYESILDAVSSVMFDDFPNVDNLNYVIKDVNEEISSDSGVAAYFNVPPLDGTGSQQMRVNPNLGDVDAITTYHTVAHEGYPGHMYQYAYAYANLTSPFRKALAESSAYTEGWAVYAQYTAYNYLTDIDQNLLAFLRENDLASYCAVILADIGIHYDGWSYDEFAERLSSLFGDDEEALLGQYKQLQANPCAFEPYYVGYEEIMAIRENATEKLGDSFNEKEFNEAVLKSGNAPFSVVEKNVDSYIASKSK